MTTSETSITIEAAPAAAPEAANIAPQALKLDSTKPSFPGTERTYSAKC